MFQIECYAGHRLAPGHPVKQKSNRIRTPLIFPAELADKVSGSFSINFLEDTPHTEGDRPADGRYRDDDRHAKSWPASFAEDSLGTIDGDIRNQGCAIRGQPQVSNPLTDGKRAEDRAAEWLDRS